MRGRFPLALLVLTVWIGAADAGPLRTVETSLSLRGPRIDPSTGALDSEAGGPRYDPATGVFRGLGRRAVPAPSPEDGFAVIRRARDYPPVRIRRAGSDPVARAPAPLPPKAAPRTAAVPPPAEGVALLGVGLFGFTGYVLRRRRRTSSLQGTP